MEITEKDAVKALQKAIRNAAGAFIDPKWRTKDRHPYRGYCYIASEILRYELGEEWVPQQLTHHGISHWFLKHKETGKILDPTAKQFSTPVPYEKSSRTRLPYISIK